jgi:hypothetical protein
MAFFLLNISQQVIGAAVISVTTGQCIGITDRALIMAVYMYQLYSMPAEQTLLGLHTMKLSFLL